MKLLNKLLSKNPDFTVSDVVVFKDDFNRQSIEFHKFNELVKLCTSDDDYKDLVFITGSVQKSLLGEDQLYLFVRTKEYDELCASVESV